MKVIIHLEKIVDAECLKHASALHTAYWEHNDNSWLYGSDSSNDSIIIEAGVPTGYLSMNGKFWFWDDTKDVKECSTFSNPFTNGSICCNRWNKVKHNFIPVLEIVDVENAQFQIASILYKNDEIEIMREFKTLKEDSDPFLYFIDVFKHDIEDSDKAFDEEKSHHTMEIDDLLDILKDDLEIPKLVIKQLEESDTFKHFVEEHNEKLEKCRIFNNQLRRKNEPITKS